ncbi:MAG: MarR family transcriptional regulator [Gemmatimonadota bacterium]|nr:MarR family transcriptional regulator [Gemmatimonadota bacterium]
MPDSRSSTAALDVADRLHSAAIHLLRRLRAEDTAGGLTAPKLSALSVIVFGGPITMGELAQAEQVKPPTITKLVKELELERLVSRKVQPSDTRVQRITATARGKKLLYEGRLRRVRTLARDLESLSLEDRKTLVRAAELLEKVSLPSESPRRGR